MTEVIIKTTYGEIVAQLYDSTPKTTANFISLVEKSFYNGLTFHRVLPGFVLQFGCPQGNGTGGPGYTIPCETYCKDQYHDVGVLSMAHRGPNTGGSQLFICLSRQQTAHLDGKHTCFGRVVQGLEILPQIKQGDVIESIVIK